MLKWLVSFTALFFSVGIWCPVQKETVLKDYCNIIIIPFNYIYIYYNYILYIYIHVHVYIITIIIINNELLAYDKHNNYIVIDNFLSD